MKIVWLKRASISYQLRYKKETDTILLSKYIKRIMGREDFFLNRQIGLALLKYRKVKPQNKIDFLASEPTLSNLSIRESLRRNEIN